MVSTNEKHSLLKPYLALIREHVFNLHAKNTDFPQKLKHRIHTERGLVKWRSKVKLVMVERYRFIALDPNNLKLFWNFRICTPFSCLLKFEVLYLRGIYLQIQDYSNQNQYICELLNKSPITTSRWTSHSNMIEIKLIVFTIINFIINLSRDYKRKIQKEKKELTDILTLKGKQTFLVVPWR